MDKKCLHTFHVQLTDGIPLTSNPNDAQGGGASGGMNGVTGTGGATSGLGMDLTNNDIFSSTELNGNGNISNSGHGNANGNGNGNPSNSTSGNGNGNSLEAMALATIPIGTSLSLNLTKQEAHLYHYYRWLWIQFPWLAMPSSFSDEVNEIFSSTSVSASQEKRRSQGYYEEIAKATVSQEKLKIAMNRDGVIIQRSQSARVTSTSNSSNTATGQPQGGQGQGQGPTGGAGGGTSGGNGNGGNTATVIGNENSLSTLLPPAMGIDLSPEEMRRREIASRSWQAKKQDPSLGRVVSASQSRTNALIKARYLTFRS
jgi:hypothetical protein